MKKDRVAIIVGGLNPRKAMMDHAKSEESDDGDPEMESYAEDLIRAIKAEDAAGVVEAIKCLVCQHGDEEEGL